MLNITYWLVVIVLLFFIFELLRRKVLREKYAVVWLTLAILLILGAIFPHRVNYLSYVLGFQYLSNFVLFFFVIINLFIVMQLSLSVGKLENQSHTLAEEISLLKARIEELDSKNAK